VVYRRAAVKTLGLIGFDTIPSLVDSLLNSDNVVVKASAGKALAQIAVNYKDVPFPEVGINALKATINDPNPVVHIVSIVKVLTALSKDESQDTYIQESAKSALSRLDQLTFFQSKQSEPTITDN
jgi:bilin biosynthesis protein